MRSGLNCLSLNDNLDENLENRETYDYDYDDTYESDDENRYRGRQGINRRYIPDEEIEASKHWHCPSFQLRMQELVRKSKLPKPKRQGPKQWGWKGVGVWGCPDSTKTVLVLKPKRKLSGWAKWAHENPDKCKIRLR